MGKMRSRIETPEGRKKYGKRKYIVEPVFGDMKFSRKMGGFLVRGKLKARGEFLIMCIAHNLRKIAKYPSNIPPEPELQLLMA
jgi:transposase